MKRSFLNVNEATPLIREGGIGEPKPPVNLLDFRSYLQDQGKPNACGTTCLAMLISFWKSQPNATTHTVIDQSIRRGGMPTSPLNLTGYLEKQQFRAVSKNEGTLDELKNYVRQGVPVMVLYDPSSKKDPILHYSVVVAEASSRQRKYLILANPTGGKIDLVPEEQFKRQWSDIRLLGQKTGLSNVMMVALPKKSTRITDQSGKVHFSDNIALPTPGKWPLSVKLFDTGADVINKIWPSGKKAGDSFDD